MATVSMDHEYTFGDRVVHAGKPEWGAGQVLSSQIMQQDGERCQRLSIRFERAGLKTISTAFADIRPAADAPMIDQATAEMGSGWLAEAGEMTPEDVMVRLPEEVSDPFRSLKSRLESTLALYRFNEEGGSLIDWAAVQSGLKDPLSRFNRHELETLFARFASERDAQLARLFSDAKRTEPETYKEMAARTPESAQRAMRSANGGR
jgi:hypothetical protein